jgi:hypothetical protein
MTNAGLENKELLYGFWTYDTYPYMLSGVIDETAGVRDSSPAARYVPSYGHWFKMTATIRGAKGLALKNELEEMRDKWYAEEKLRVQQRREGAKRTLARYGIQHPELEKT